MAIRPSRIRSNGFDSSNVIYCIVSSLLPELSVKPLQGICIQIPSGIGRASWGHCIGSIKQSRSIPYSSKVGISISCRSISTWESSFSQAVSLVSSAPAKPQATAIAPKRSLAPSAAYWRHIFRSIALEIPWGTWNSAPIGLLMPWTKVTEELLNAIPASNAASDIWIRASSWSPCSHAVLRLSKILRHAESANVSDKGCAFLEV